ncbi:hypothetical protein CH302_27510 [Rhodococcus sp. 15-2388-1-1a]|uniref:hypothetical protein n=1 Tax=Rhodococcus sp. 15-2388-1-1a TaxID=2023142 RepID=UPI000B9C3243|nr:hypothetical protein [Rhodococcus sp. 15-2388-1-1a]OZE90202.1 hypothetical protein CH302_27510 [Rhodococcus sp. 15-2388-1-1a]
MPEYFDPKNPDIGYNGRDQDKPTGIQIGNSETLRALGGVLAGDQGFENTPDAQDREYTAQVLTAGLSARVQTLEGKMAEGAEYSDNFNRINASTLGSPNPGVIPVWQQFGDGQPLEIIDQAAQLNQSAPFNLVDDGTRFALCPQAASMSDYSIVAIVHPLPKSGKIATRARTVIYGRCNAAGTEGVYVDFWGGHCELGRFTRSGNTVSRSQWKANEERSYNLSSTVELRMKDTLYVVVVDGVELIVHDDVSGFPVDGNHRYSMFSCMTWTGFFGATPEFSAGLTGFAIRGTNLTAIAQATATAENAAAAAGAVLGIAENADAKATLAQETAEAAQDAVQDALDGAQQQGKEWMVASGGVVLGRNEVNIGPVIVVPTGRDFRVTSITYGMESNTGTLTIQLVKVSPTRVSTVIHTANIATGVVEAQFTNLNIPIENGCRYACNVTSISATASVLLCSVDGALL